MSKPKRSYKTICIRLDKDVWEYIEEKSIKEDRSFSSTVRNLCRIAMNIENMVDKKQKKT